MYVQRTQGLYLSSRLLEVGTIPTARNIVIRFGQSHFFRLEFLGPVSTAHTAQHTKPTKVKRAFPDRGNPTLSLLRALQNPPVEHCY